MEQLLNIGHLVEMLYGTSIRFTKCTRKRVCSAETKTIRCNEQRRMMFVVIVWNLVFTTDPTTVCIPYFGTYSRMAEERGPERLEMSLRAEHQKQIDTTL